MTPTVLLVATLVVLVGCAVQGAVGFGMNLIAAPILLIVEPLFVPGPLIVAGLLLTVLMIRREPAAASGREVTLAVGARIPGNLLGVAILVAVSAENLQLVFGAIILVAVCLSAAGWTIAISDRSLVCAGLASGVLGTTVSIGGAPFGLLYQHASGPALRGTLARILALGSVLSIVTIVVVDQFAGEAVLGRDEWVAAGALLPAAAAGFLVSPLLARHLDAGHTRTAVLSVSGVAATVAVGQGIWG